MTLTRNAAGPLRPVPVCITDGGHLPDLGRDQREMPLRKPGDVDPNVQGSCRSQFSQDTAQHDAISGGNASLTVARPATDQDVGTIQDSLAGLVKNTRLTSPSRLLIDAPHSSGDRLEAFILAWAALEMAIRKCTIGCEAGDWLKGVAESDRVAAAALHQNYLDGGHQQYSLAQKARAFALCHGLGSGDELAAEITGIRKGYREPLYHEGMIAAQLPVEAVVALARRVLRTALA
jgi:hypothetical protein